MNTWLWEPPGFWVIFQVKAEPAFHAVRNYGILHGIPSVAPDGQVSPNLLNCKGPTKGSEKSQFAVPFFIGLSQDCLQDIYFS